MYYIVIPNKINLQYVPRMYADKYRKLAHSFRVSDQIASRSYIERLPCIEYKAIPEWEEHIDSTYGNKVMKYSKFRLIDLDILINCKDVDVVRKVF